MAMKGLLKKRMKEIIWGDGRWMGGVKFAKSVVSGPSPSAPGQPPGYRGEVSGGKPMSLRAGITGQIKSKGKSVEGYIYSVATRDGYSYPAALEMGWWPPTGARPWLKPTGKMTAKMAKRIMSKSLSGKQLKQFKGWFGRQIGKKSYEMSVSL